MKGYLWIMALGLLFVLACNPAGAESISYTEELVTFQYQGQDIVGDLVLPESQEPLPMVLLLHGFTGQRQELPVAATEQGIFQLAASELAQRGIGSLRIDFRGSGDSEGAWEDTTFNSQIADAMAALEFLLGLEEVDGERLGIIGYSQGGLVGASAAGRSGLVSSLVLWAPVATPSFTYGNLLGTDLILSAAESEEHQLFTALLPWGDEVTLKASFFKELFTVNPLAEIISYTNPLMVLVGLEDDIVEPQPQAGEAFLAYHRGEQKLISLDTDHIFDCFETRDTVDDVISHTLQWFQDTL